MNTRLMNLLKNSPTAYHAVENAKNILTQSGYAELHESAQWELREGGKYFAIKDGSALVAFHIGNSPEGINIVASHTDSPALKLKLNPVVSTGNYVKLNVERYGGGLNYSWLDIPLRIAGRIILREGSTLVSRLVFDPHNVVIPSVAVHFNREVNAKGLVLNPQTDLQPIISQTREFELKLLKENESYEILDYDLFLTNAEEPFFAGFEDEFMAAPRIDNLTSVFSSVESLVAANPKNIAMAYLADNEEVGSGTKQGAGGTFLKRAVSRIAKALRVDKDILISNSFMVSCDNAHANHPNHPELADPTNPVSLNGGIVIKHHANQNYTTDAFSSSVIKALAKAKGIPTQDFFMRADLPCGGTLGAINSSQLSIRSADIGLAQLAMHSTMETMGSRDYRHMVKFMEAFYSAKITCPAHSEIVIG